MFTPKVDHAWSFDWGYAHTHTHTHITTLQKGTASPVRVGKSDRKKKRATSRSTDLAWKQPASVTPFRIHSSLFLWLCCLISPRLCARGPDFFPCAAGWRGWRPYNGHGRPRLVLSAVGLQNAIVPCDGLARCWWMLRSPTGDQFCSFFSFFSFL